MATKNIKQHVYRYLIMCAQYQIVPWFNSEEWRAVYQDVYSENPNKGAALDVLQMWKARCPALPSGIESTLTLLEVNIQDEKSDVNITSDHILRLAYSSALMRFVNHMLDTDTARGTSLYNAAKNAGVPDWIVDLRHETAHSNNLPSLTLLRNACLISLEWLQKNYWDKHKQCIQDYTSGQKELPSSDENKIAALLYFCSCLSISAHSKIKKLADISDANMQESVVNDARDLFGDLIDLSNLKTVSIASLTNLVNTHAKKILQSNDTISHVNKALLGEESLFLSLDLVQYLSRNDFNNKQKLSKGYVMCFEMLLSFLHTNDLIFDFILALVKMTQNEDKDHLKKFLAALWLSEILAALKKSKQFVERANKMNSIGGVSNKKKELKVLYHHWFPNERLDGLVLDLQKSIPSKLSDINMLQPIISSYNPYLAYFVKDLLNLIDPHVPKQVCEKICKLARLISAPEKFPIQPSEKIYTIEDLTSEESFMNDNGNEMRDGVASQRLTQDQNINGIWKIAAKYNWNACPIGNVLWNDKSLHIETY